MKIEGVEKLRREAEIVSKYKNRSGQLAGTVIELLDEREKLIEVSIKMLRRLRDHNISARHYNEHVWTVVCDDFAEIVEACSNINIKIEGAGKGGEG